MNLGQYTTDMILEYLKNKKVLTDLEQDIVSSINVLNKVPYNRTDLENKIIENNIKYPDIWFKTMMQSGNVPIPFKELSDQQIKENLFMQIQNMYSYLLSTINKINE